MDETEFLDLEDVALLYEHLLPARDFCTADRLTSSLGACARPMGELAAKLGNHEQAVADFRHALWINEQLGHRPELVRTRFGLSRALLRQGREEGARAERQLGRVEAERLGLRMPELELPES